MCAQVCSPKTRSLATGWVDLGQHLVAVWHWVDEILGVYDLMGVGLAMSSLDTANEAIVTWLRATHQRVA